MLLLHINKILGNDYDDGIANRTATLQNSIDFLIINERQSELLGACNDYFGPNIKSV